MTASTDDRRSLFIVGSSRSGTTMMGRILGRHPAVHMFHELHFFEQMWSPDADTTFACRDEAIEVAARLLAIEREGGYLAPGDPAAFQRDAGRIVDRLRIRDTTALDVYRTFLFEEADRNGATIPCEQTPRNIFYLDEILDCFPEARVIHMVRDPRDVLLSQKRKWKRRFLGASSIPLWEAFRSWVNYHPLTIGRLWAASERAAAPYHDHPRVQTVAFEDVLASPEATVRAVCRFAGLDFREDMLAVRQVGSSHKEDRPEERGIDASRSGTWRDGGLSDTEIYLCQKMIAGQLDGLPYTPADASPNLLLLVASVLAFPIKLGAAFLLNLRRMDNVWDTIRRRLQ